MLKMKTNQKLKKKKKDNGVIDEPLTFPGERCQLDLLNSGLFLDSLVYRYQVASIASAVVQFCVSLSVPQIGRRARPDWDLS